jgi:hypothetical protein
MDLTFVLLYFPPEGQHCSSLGAVPLIPCGVREALHPWEMPAEWDVDGVELLCTGSYGPVCGGWLTREGRSAAVVVKALRGELGQLELYSP